MEGGVMEKGSVGTPGWYLVLGWRSLGWGHTRRQRKKPQTWEGVRNTVAKGTTQSQVITLTPNKHQKLWVFSQLGFVSLLCRQQLSMERNHSGTCQCSFLFFFLIVLNKDFSISGGFWPNLIHAFQAKKIGPKPKLVWNLSSKVSEGKGREAK